MALAGAALGALHPAVEPLDGLLFDLSVALIAGPVRPGSDDPAADDLVADDLVAVVAIDARSLDAPELVDIPRPLFQPVLAELIETLMAAEAGAVGLDLLLGYSGNRLVPGHDRSLLAALHRHRDRLVVGRSSRTLPVPSVVAATGFDPWSMGLMELAPDADGVYRRVGAASQPTVDEPVPTLAAAVLQKLGRAMPPEVLLVPRRHPGELPAYALIDVLRCGRADPQVLRHAFAGKVVLVGSVLAEEDRKMTSARFLRLDASRQLSRRGCLAAAASPASPASGTVPGVLVHALAVDAVLRGAATTAAPREAVATAAGLSGLAGAVLGMAAPPLLAAAGVVLVAGGAWAVAVALLGQQLWFPPAAAMLAVLAGAGIAYPIRYALERAYRRWLQSAFGHYLAPALVDRLSADPSLLRLGGETREVTVLFCDLRGFTAISERLADRPERLVRLVNRLLTTLTEPVLEHGGTVDKYLGDSVMAFWNAPLDDPDHARHAVAAALGMVAAMALLNGQLSEEAAASGAEDVGPLAVGIGINTGRVVVGNMGSASRFDYTVMGDAVNLASRLQGQCKVYGAEIIVSAATRACAPEVAALELDRIAVRGRSREEVLFAVVGDGMVAARADYRAAQAHHTALLAALRAADRTAAEGAADAACRAWPALCGVYQGFRRRIAQIRPD